MSLLAAKQLITKCSPRNAVLGCRTHDAGAPVDLLNGSGHVVRGVAFVGPPRKKPTRARVCPRPRLPSMIWKQKHQHRSQDEVVFFGPTTGELPL